MTRDQLKSLLKKGTQERTADHSEATRIDLDPTSFALHHEAHYMDDCHESWERGLSEGHIESLEHMMIKTIECGYGELPTPVQYSSHVWGRDHNGVFDETKSYLIQLSVTLNDSEISIGIQRAD